MLIIVSLIFAFNLSAFIMEAFLVFDQLVRFMAFTQYQKTFETWPAMAT